MSDQERYRRFFLWRAAVLPLWMVIGLIQGTWWIAAAGIVGTLAIVGMAMARKRQRERAARR